VAGTMAGQVARTLARWGTVNAQLAGTSEDDTWGLEYGHWFAVTFPDGGAEAAAQGEVGRIAWAFGQDAVAWTSGTTTVVTNPARVEVSA